MRGATPRQAGVRKTQRKPCPARQVQGDVGVGVAIGSGRKNIQEEDKQLGQGSSEVLE